MGPDGVEREPTAEEVAQRVHYLVSPDHRFLCRTFDVLVSIITLS
jgi:hypothetical protein